MAFQSYRSARRHWSWSAGPRLQKWTRSTEPPKKKKWNKQKKCGFSEPPLGRAALKLKRRTSTAEIKAFYLYFGQNRKKTNPMRRFRTMLASTASSQQCASTFWLKKANPNQLSKREVAENKGSCQNNGLWGRLPFRQLSGLNVQVQSWQPAAMIPWVPEICVSGLGGKLLRWRGRGFVNAFQHDIV